MINKPKRNKPRKYTEAQIADLFNLYKIKPINTLMSNWLNTSCSLDIFEQNTFNIILKNAKYNIEAWNEEDLKMKFISFVLQLSNFQETRDIRTFFEKTIESEVE